MCIVDLFTLGMRVEWKTCPMEWCLKSRITLQDLMRPQAQTQYQSTLPRWSKHQQQRRRSTEVQDKRFLSSSQQNLWALTSYYKYGTYTRIMYPSTCKWYFAT